MRWISLLCLVSLFAIIGCGGDSVGIVQGIVTLDDKPIGGVGVNFLLKTGDVLVATTTETGNYQLEIPTGDAKIGLSALDGGEQSTGEDAKKPTLGGVPAKPKSRIPLYYSDPENSGFKLTVTSGVNNYDIKLKSK